MNSEFVQNYFDMYPEFNELAFEGKCHDCGCDVTVVIVRTGIEGQIFEVDGGALYNPNETMEPGGMFLKCNNCFTKNNTLENYQRNEVYSRIVGYLRPVTQWNEAKEVEFHNRKMFDLKDIDTLEKAASSTV